MSSLSFREFYVDYQPWITLIYLAIFAGPLVAIVQLVASVALAACMLAVSIRFIRALANK